MDGQTKAYIVRTKRKASFIHLESRAFAARSRNALKSRTR